MSGARTLQRGLAVLIAVRDSATPLSVSDIARLTGLDRAVVARLLPPLLDEGFVARDVWSRSFSLGPAMDHRAERASAEEGSSEADMESQLLSHLDSWGEFSSLFEESQEDLYSNDSHFANALTDDAYYALMSFVAGIPVSTIAELVSGADIPGPFSAMMGEVELDHLGPEADVMIDRMKGIDPVAAFIIFFEALPERDQQMLFYRLSTRPDTLEDIAGSFGITRERVRQVIKRRRQEFEATLEADVVIQQRTAMAREALGGIVDVDDLTVTLSMVLPMLDYLPSELEELLLFLLFPDGTFTRYSDKASWFVTAAARERIDEVRAQALSEGIALDAFAEAVSEVGRVPDIAAFAASIGLMDIDGELFAKNLSLNDRAALLLRREAAPLSFDDIVGALGAQERIRSLRNALLADDRIVRVDRDTFALAEWDLPAYSTVRDLIRQELERVGGEASIADIKERLTARFDIKASSIAAYTRAPEFVRVAPGIIRLRADDESIDDVERPLEALRGCVRMGRRWALRVEISHSLLKGFSVLLPSGMARHFGVAQGQSAQLATDLSSEISVVRRSLQDNIGRLRWVAEELGLSEGDILFIRLPERSGGRISFMGLSRAELEAAAPALRAGLLLGLREELTLSTACSTLGLTRRSTAADVVDRLHARGEVELAGLVGEVLGADGVSTVDTKDIGRMLGLL